MRVLAPMARKARGPGRAPQEALEVKDLAEDRVRGQLMGDKARLRRSDELVLAIWTRVALLSARASS